VPRNRLSNVLQSHLFWAFDASNSGVPVFNPLFGFSKITAPTINAEIETFKDGTFLYNRSVVKGGSASPVIFERATSMFDADFYDWIMFTIHGNKDFEGDGGTLGKITNFLTGGGTVSPRRSLLIVHFTNINLSDSGGSSIAGSVAIGVLTGLIGGAAVGAAVGVGAAVAATGVQVPIALGPFQFAMRVPARAWILHNCLPTRYKSGSDFDANSAAISLQELEVLPEFVEEFNLGLKP
jgi:phage tail-like protein